jgi:hypothetical protein
LNHPSQRQSMVLKLNQPKTMKSYMKWNKNTLLTWSKKSNHQELMLFYVSGVSMMKPITC